MGGRATNSNGGDFLIKSTSRRKHKEHSRGFFSIVYIRIKQSGPSIYTSSYNIVPPRLLLPSNSKSPSRRTQPSQVFPYRSTSSLIRN
ncbi:hypothetical protein L1887_09686 [Cichorium endivia]|nr:hypothetical protein L1887_09686 [Cichorium endivia]